MQFLFIQEQKNKIISCLIETIGSHQSSFYTKSNCELEIIIDIMNLKLLYDVRRKFEQGSEIYKI